MTMIQLIACIGMIAGLFMVLGISPAEMSDSIFSRLTAAPGSIRADINETTKRKKAGFFRREILIWSCICSGNSSSEIPVLIYTVDLSSR